MRKVVVLLFLLSLILFTVSAFTPTSDSSLNILGFYDPTTSTVKLMVFDDTGQQMLYATNAEVGSDHLSSSHEIFNWTLVGNLNGAATLSFEFSDFQAYLNNKYYRPAYTVEYVINPTTVNDVAVSDDSFSFNSSNSSGLTSSKISKTKVTQTYTFADTATFYFSGTRSNNNNETWTRSGYFTLYISDYDNVTSGDFKYRSNVTVEYTAE